MLSTLRNTVPKEKLWDKPQQCFNIHFDLYELAIEKRLENAPASVFILPEKFLHHC